MRLWHWKLIPYLPEQQLLGQWRECCLIAKNIAEKGTPNHILVNPVMDYPSDEFIEYSIRVHHELRNRGHNVKIQSFIRHLRITEMLDVLGCFLDKNVSTDRPLFKDWHTPKYLTQCLANLEEKHDRGGIPDNEWNYLLRSIGRKGAKK